MGLPLQNDTRDMTQSNLLSTASYVLLSVASTSLSMVQDSVANTTSRCISSLTKFSYTSIKRWMLRYDNGNGPWGVCRFTSADRGYEAISTNLV